MQLYDVIRHLTQREEKLEERDGVRGGVNYEDKKVWFF